MSGGDHPETLLTLPAAADLAGVHYMTAYRWVRTSRLKAQKSGGVWMVRLGDLMELTDAKGTPEVGASSGTQRPGGCTSTRIGPMTEALLRGDQGGAWLLVEESRRAGVDPVDVLCEVLEPAMVEIGRRWRRGETSIGAEHRATGVATRLVARLGSTVTRPGRSRGHVVVGAVEGNRHGLGPAVLADAFRAVGFDVCDLGADVPFDEFVEIASTTRPLTGLCLSVADATDLAGVQQAIARVRAVSDAVVLVGGAGVPDQDWATEVGADGWCADARGAPEVLERCTTRPSQRGDQPVQRRRQAALS